MSHTGSVNGLMMKKGYLKMNDEECVEIVLVKNVGIKVQLLYEKKWHVEFIQMGWTDIHVFALLL